jgi:predicted ATP-binding protein involved in virulence
VKGDAPVRIKSVRLVNYACFKDTTVEFNSGVNVVVGVNGSGKTSLLNAIGEYLNYYLNRICHIRNARIEMQTFNGNRSFEPQYPVSLEVTVWHAEEPTITTTVFTRNNDIQNVPDILVGQGHLRKGTITETTLLPLVAHYGADRIWKTDKSSGEIIAIAQEKTSRSDSYNECLFASVSIKALNDWVVAKTLERLQAISQTTSSPSGNNQYDDELSLVNAAISLAIPGAKGLSFDIKQRSMLVEWETPDGGEPKYTLFDKLSDGERVIVALIADIARRICMANPQLGADALKETPGVVLIDEIDLHLHPQWERQLPIGLKKAFPSVQFIATTHSPQILSELSPGEIIILNNETAERPQFSYGLTSDGILEGVMDANSRPLTIKNQLSKLFAAIERGQLDESKNILAELTKNAPGIPEIATGSALIKRKEAIGL